MPQDFYDPSYRYDPEAFIHPTPIYMRPFAPGLWQRRGVRYLVLNQDERLVAAEIIAGDAGPVLSVSEVPPRWWRLLKTGEGIVADDELLELVNRLSARAAYRDEWSDLPDEIRDGMLDIEYRILPP